MSVEGDELEGLYNWAEPLEWSAFLAGDTGGMDWLIEPIVPVGTQVAIWARGKTGKSEFVLCACAELATGRPVLGAPAAEPVDVIYVDMENPAFEVIDRMLAVGYEPTSDLKHLHYFHMASLPPFDTELGGAVLAAQVVKFKARLVVVDTTASTTTGAENDSDTYRGFYRHSGSRLRAMDVALVRLDHAGKDLRRGQRGSSAKDDDVDVVFEMSRFEGGHLLKRRLSRISWVPEEVYVTREDTPTLRYLLAPAALPEGALEVADLLDELGVDLGASVRVAMELLRASGNGRRRDVVAAALKYRRRPR